MKPSERISIAARLIAIVAERLAPAGYATEAAVLGFAAEELSEAKDRLAGKSPDGPSGERFPAEAAEPQKRRRRRSRKSPPDGGDG